ncbi:MAG: DUF624 domain-containing protein [Clostridia bacterium]|nr:DUF624 domain-containing protein [Clostridia bacterium]
MGFFSHHYDKPGPGVDPDAPKKRSFFRFFEILSRKFWKIGQVNLIYSIVLIPIFLILMTASTTVVGNLAGVFGMSDEESMSAALLVGGLIFTNLFIAAWGAGPVTAGISYIMRNYSREEHAWVWTDFKDEAKSNFKQATIVFVIDLIMIFVFNAALSFYSGAEGSLGILKYVVWAIILVYTLMHFYIYPIMITFDLPLKDIYKNSLIFAMGKLPSNLFVLIVLMAVHIGLPVCTILFCGKQMPIILVIIYLLELVFLQGFSAYLVNFNAYPKLKKYMLDVIEDKKE